MPRTPSIVVTLVLAGCATASGAIPELDIVTADADDDRVIAAPIPQIAPAAKPDWLADAPRDAARQAFPADAHELSRKLASWFEDHATQRIHTSLDRPLYRPGEVVWFKVWDLDTRGMDPNLARGRGTSVQLRDPRGSVQQNRSLQPGQTGDAFDLPPTAPGGEWAVVVVHGDGRTTEHPFVVASFEAPRIKKTLDFAREGYGPGDTVSAALTLERSTGELLANTAFTARVQADGTPLEPLALTTDARGEATVTFELPAKLERPDVLLTVLVDDAGVTESISRPVPVVLDRVQLAFFPEGGDAVAGLRGRIYVEATDPFGEPADIQGAIVTERGRTIAPLHTWKDGRGHVSFTPELGERYFARVDSPAGLEDTLFELPAAADDGCVMTHHDDLRGEQDAVRVSVRCTDERDVVLLATQQEQIVDKAALHVQRGRATTVHLRSAVPALREAPGVARVTLFDGDLDPLAERLVFRNFSQQLHVEITPDRERYEPRDEVTLTVKTTLPSGEPVPAEVALSVVDDRLLSHADDEEHTLLSGMLLQADLPEPIEDVAKLWDPEEDDGALAVDLVLGTRGWRRFDWVTVEGYERPHAVASTTRARPVPRPQPRPAEARRQMQELELALGDDAMLGDLGYVGVLDAMPGAGGVAAALGAEEAQGDKKAGFFGRVAEDVGGLVARREMPPMAAPEPMPEPVLAKDEAWGGDAPAADFRNDNRQGAKGRRARGPRQVPVRVFPKPHHQPGYDGPRTDFRDTVMWEPRLITGAAGTATVAFHLSDAVTGFLARAEGVGGGLLGQGETLLPSTLPFHLDARLPVALSAGDRLLVPVTLENQRDGSAEVTLDVQLSGLVELEDDAPGSVTLAGGERRTVHVPLIARSGTGSADLSLTATAQGLSDAVDTHIPVQPRGFPQGMAQSGVLEGRIEHRIVVPEVVPGSLQAHVTAFPTPVSELLDGIEGIVRQPGGCFEQTSSGNYPNILVLDWLDRTGGGGSLAVDREQVLQTGYDILSGYQVDSGAFETFGSGPGKEALTAFGLLQFTDMQRVFEVDRAILDDNLDYLEQQRTGKGGFETTGASAHGYGNAPADVLDAYITWALVETGNAKGFGPEVDAQAERARRNDDPYQLALQALTLQKARPADGRTATERLAGLQANDGSFPGSAGTIQRSGEENVLVETTALATIALARAGEVGPAQQGARWLAEHRMGGGVWGATQANVLALRALSTVAEASARARGEGTITVSVDGDRVHTTSFDADDREPLDLDLSEHLSEGSHTVTLELDGQPLPYSLEWSWNTEIPLSDSDRRVDLETTLADDHIATGDTVRMHVELANRTDEVVPDPIARIGLPAGLEPQTWQLQQLKDRGVIAFFETRPREVTLYWEGVHGDHAHELDLDLVATVPGAFTAPASSAYPYYDDHHKAWTAGHAVTIDPS